MTTVNFKLRTKRWPPVLVKLMTIGIMFSFIFLVISKEFNILYGVFFLYYFFIYEQIIEPMLEREKDQWSPTAFKVVQGLSVFIFILLMFGLLLYTFIALTLWILP